MNGFLPARLWETLTPGLNANGSDRRGSCIFNVMPGSGSLNPRIRPSGRFTTPSMVASLSPVPLPFSLSPDYPELTRTSQGVILMRISPRSCQ